MVLLFLSLKRKVKKSSNKTKALGTRSYEIIAQTAQQADEWFFMLKAGAEKAKSKQDNNVNLSLQTPNLCRKWKYETEVKVLILQTLSRREGGSLRRARRDSSF